jgi:hypothetical protein
MVNTISYLQCVGKVRDNRLSSRIGHRVVKIVTPDFALAVGYEISNARS